MMLPSSVVVMQVFGMLIMGHMFEPVTQDHGKDAFSMPGKIRHVSHGDETAHAKRNNHEAGKKAPEIGKRLVHCNC